MKSKNIEISIVVCTYNRENKIERCLKTLLSLDFPKDKYEVIVVDDSSSDKTVEIVKKFPVKLVVHAKNRGVAAARNSGLREVRGKIVVCFDDDCYVTRDWLKCLYKVYRDKQFKSIAGVCGIIQIPSKTTLVGEYLKDSGYGNPSPKNYVTSKNIFTRFFSYVKNMFNPHIEKSNRISEVGEIWGANCSFPKEVLETVGGWDETLSGVEDTDLCNRIHKGFPKKKFFCTKNAVLIHDDQMSLFEFISKPFKRGKAILSFYRKNRKIPPLFPFPIFIFTILLVISLIKPILIIPFAILLPLLFYSWWIIRAYRLKKLYSLLFPYVQLLQETATILGLISEYVFNTPYKKERVMLFLLAIYTSITFYVTFHYLIASMVVSSLFLLFVPGFLLSWILRVTYQDAWELLVYSLGLSISFLMLGGLGLNFLLPYYHLSNHPLTFMPFFRSFGVLVASMIGYLFIFVSPIPIRTSPSICKKDILLSIIPSTFLILSMIGAFKLNNHESNFFTLLMLGSIGAYVLLIAFVKDKIPRGIYIYSIFLIALSLLLMTSLRGWFVTGHDIMLETYVFQLTKNHGFWNMASFQDPYMACLSITILPTIISIFTHIPNFYIYKIIFQIIFAFMGVATYLFLEKFLDKFLSFLGTFIILSLPTFMSDMPMLNRQEVALLYFTMLLCTFFTNSFSKKIKWFFYILFGLSITVSHYSTTYITLSVFVGTYVAYLFLRIIYLHPSVKKLFKMIDKKLSIEHNKAHIELFVVATILISTLVWNFSITHTSQDIIKTLTSISNFIVHKKAINTTVSTDAYGLVMKKNPTSQQLLQEYVEGLTLYVRKFNTDAAFSSKTIYSQYSVSLGKQEILPTTNIGKALQKIRINPFSIYNALKDIYAKSIQGFIAIGLLLLILYKKYIKNFKKEYIILQFVFFSIIVSQALLPSSTINYGILRLFQQGLIVLIIPLLIGALSIFSIFDFINKNIKFYILTLLFVFFFLFLSGFLGSITGGYYPQMNTDNAGFYYDTYYTHGEEYTSINWLLANRNIKTPIQSDWFMGNKIHTYGNIYTIDALIPSTIRINSYVYISYSDLSTGNVIEYVNGVPIYYRLPFAYLNSNKNLIYSSGNTRIYR